MNKKFKIKTRQGLCKMTADEIYSKVLLNSSLSNYDWFASAPALYQVCEDPAFPVEYARGIKLAILNCYASIHRTIEYDISFLEKAVVNNIYNELASSKDPAVINARINFLESIISESEALAYELPIFYRNQYNEIRSEWHQRQIFKYISINYVNVYDLIEKLTMELRQSIKEADTKGLLDLDKEERKRDMQMKFDRIIKMFKCETENDQTAKVKIK